MGHKKAVEFYKKLLKITREAALDTNADSWLWYGDFINPEDDWNPEDFYKKMQHGDDLGSRMKNAFQEAFDSGYEKVAIVGSDCPEISSEIIEKSYQILDEKDIAIGPANDGGYYLLAMKNSHDLFSNIEWSTEAVFPKTLEKIENQNLTVGKLPELTDLDTVEDLKKFPQL